MTGRRIAMRVWTSSSVTQDIRMIYQVNVVEDERTISLKS